MRSVYKVLAYLIALEVAVQAAAMVFAVAGLGIWITEGNSADEAAFEGMFEGDVTFTGVGGLMVHAINGMMVIPVLALVLLIVSFFAKLPRGIAAAAALLLLVVVQVALGLFGHSNAYFGLLHGANALLLFAGALHAARLASVRTTAAAERTYVDA
ncbi:MAG TPA: hypothetical protein VER39_00540 [Nocardioidaceae bacterium]|nr:hypothetical protein [Nocardioidaceae bacterium]